MSVLTNHLSVIITKNEVHAIAYCLRSVAWIDETVVLNSGATDETVSICEKMGAKATVTNDCSGFGTQKNRALTLATQPWVLSLDADERVSSALPAEIERVIVNNTHGNYRIPRSSSYCGHLSSILTGHPITTCFYLSEAMHNLATIKCTST